MNFDLRDSIVRNLKSSGETAGTGFVLNTDGLIVTCSHVIQGNESQKRGEPKPERTTIVFHATGESQEAQIEPDWWCSSNRGEDVAFLRVKGGLPEGVRSLLPGSSKGTSNHPFDTFGFPKSNPEQGIWGDGHILGETQTQYARVRQLSSPQVTSGFSGAPVVDRLRHRVVGMVTSIIRPDEYGRQNETAFMTPIETLRDVCSVFKLSDDCPYRNLKAFTEADAMFFRGRERVIEMLIDNLQNEPRFLAVFGASGSGKSSVVQAGLIPRLRNGALPGSDRWDIRVTRPADAFFKQHLAHLDQASASVALVIDQFEELFYDETASLEVMTQLTHLLEHLPHVTLLIVMRDDFYSLLVRQEALAMWLKSRVVNVWSTLKREEVESIVREPAELMGWQFEEGLVEMIVDDVLATSAKGHKKDENSESSTILPLLEFTLTQLWERRQDGILTHEAYRRIGGVTGGLRQWANNAYYTFEERLRPLVRQIFTDLVYLGDEEQHIPDSRRRRILSTLIHSDAERTDISQIVQQLATDRLLVTSQDQESKQEIVEIIHDALLWEWGLLKGWVEEDRTFLRWHQVLEGQAQAWVEKRDKDKLLRGSDLIEAIDYLGKRHGKLNQLEREFIRASKDRKRFEERRRALMIVGGVAVLGLAFIGGPTATTIENFINTTLLEKQNLLKNIEALTPGVNISEYKKIFGDPRFINQNGAENFIVQPVKKIKEYVFVNKYFYLNTVTDTNDEVQYFAVTIRDKAFNPTFKMGVFQITLGISKFKDIADTPEYILGCVGAHDFYYHEIHYFGNQGYYEQFGFELNEAGYLANTYEDFIPSLSKIDLCLDFGTGKRPQFTQQDLKNLQPLRAKTIFNTYAVATSSFEDYNPKNDLGVTYDQVRTLQE